MKILYALSGTGNGHVSRARDVIPHLQEHGEVKIALTGAHNEVELPVKVDHHFSGPGFFFGKDGGVDYRRTFIENKLPQILREARCFRPQKYDLIVNDFEPVTAWAARLRGEGQRVVAFGHQPSFLSDKTPRPEKRSPIVEFLFRNYAPSDTFVGLHFAPYDSFIRTPVIRKEVRDLQVTNAGHYVVYLPAYGDEILLDVLSRLPQAQWVVFSRHCTGDCAMGNVRFLRIHSEGYLNYLAGSAGLLTGGGFEAPAEALYLGKKVLMIPMRNQYEQLCNAAAARQLGVPVLSEFSLAILPQLTEWLHNPWRLKIDFPDETADIVSELVTGFRKAAAVAPAVSIDSPGAAERRINN